mmetsp:Transcript_15808/g.19602  ORF Transcript_15808/g.19602 Transcript_15808/m.19602 type:complete len:147 (-) Transcript_15808:351-791(-)
MSLKQDLSVAALFSHDTKAVCSLEKYSSTQANSELLVLYNLNSGMVATGIWEGNVAQEKIESWELSPWLIDNMLLPAFRSLRDQVMWTASQGAWTQTYLATQVPKSDSGKYFHPINRQVAWHEMANDETLEKRFWDFSMQLVEGQC